MSEIPKTDTVKLFHGPGAFQAALLAAGENYLQFPCPDDKGVVAEVLKVDDAREVVKLLWSVPLGGKTHYVIVGPLDKAPAKSSDTLLKAIEEPRPYAYVAILWATDEGGVSPTIRSRCQAIWAGASSDMSAMLIDAKVAISNCLKGNAQDLSLLMAKWRGKEAALLDALCAVVAASKSKKVLGLWPQLRMAAMDQRGPCANELATILAGTVTSITSVSDGTV